MTPQELTNSLDRLISGANDRLAASIARTQNQLASKLSNILKDLDIDPEGMIRQTAANRRILARAQSEFDFIISNDTAYQSSIERYLRNVPKIESLNAAYFETISDAFSPNKVFIKQLQKQAIAYTNNILLQDGFVANVKTPLADILSQNINTGGSYSGMLDQIRTFIRGNENLDGRLISYSRGILNDTLYQYSRGYQQSVTADLGLEWYRYIGGLVKDSRSFCIERAGKYFHHKEIEAWGSLEWQGRNRYTTSSSIFVVAGGYNCSHSIVPVHISIVPEDVIERNIAAGNYKRSA